MAQKEDPTSTPARHLCRARKSCPTPNPPLWRKNEAKTRLYVFWILKPQTSTFHTLNRHSGATVPSMKEKLASGGKILDCLASQNPKSGRTGGLPEKKSRSADCVASMEESLSFTWSTRSAPRVEGYNDPCDDLRTLRKQKKILRKQAWALKIYKRNDEFWKLAQEHGCGT